MDAVEGELILASPLYLSAVVQTISSRAGNEPSRARLGSARFGSVVQRAEPGSARQFHEPIEEARLGSLSARELARAGSRATTAHCITEQFL